MRVLPAGFVPPCRRPKLVGRPRISAELRNLIGAMSRANHLWGAPHIHGELLKLGFTIAQSTVARYMYRGWPPSQGWRTFLTNHVDGIAAIDLFVMPTITFRLLYCLVILRHGRRLWVTFGVTTNPTAEWISRQIIEAFPWDSSPRYLIRDRDTAYGVVFRQRLRAMGIRDKPTAPRSPWQLVRADAMRILVLLRPTIARFAPSAASASAAANPMPLVAPVIRICLSFTAQH